MTEAGAVAGEGPPARRALPRRSLAVLATIGLLAGAALALLAARDLAPFARDGANRSAAAPATAAAVPTANVDRFSGQAAFSEASYQVSLGPRPAGSPTSAALAERLATLLPSGRLEPVPGGLRNVVGHLPGRQPAIVIAAHYDTKDIPGFVGANDGASGTAAVVQLARSLAVHRATGDSELRFVLFDGEESPPGSPESLRGFLQYGLRGSKAYVAAHRQEVAKLILLDFVGDRNLSLPREAGSNAKLWSQLRAAAKRVGVGRVFPDRKVGRIYDDHYPFTEAGIPAIDLIDFTYPYFHTNQDTLDKISASSLDAVGEAVVELARGL